MMAKPMKTLELHYPMIQFLIMGNTHNMGQLIVDTKASTWLQQTSLYKIPLNFHDKTTIISLTKLIDTKFQIYM